MKIEFYGVRGSMPTPGKSTVLFGGNTSCVYVELNDGSFLILDAGTGIVNLSKKLNNYKKTINILLTHSHWDHIQGFPYFQPIYQNTANISIIVGASNIQGNKMILEQMSGANHPVKYQELPSTISLDTSSAHKKNFILNNFSITTQALNHPDGGTAYCIEGDNQKVAYVTDNELIPPYQTSTSWDEWVEFIAEADVLIHDAQYDDNDMPTKHGWGHSTYTQVVDLAIQAKVKQLFFISHDPSKTDTELLQHEKKIQAIIPLGLQVAWAREGTLFNVNEL